VPPKFGEKYFYGNYHVKFWHFVNFSYIYFRAKMSSPKLTELLRLWVRCCNLSVTDKLKSSAECNKSVVYLCC